MQEEKIKIRTIFNDAKKLREALENYFIHCKEFDEIPTKLGMLIYLDITENTLKKMKRKKRNTFLQQINGAHSQIERPNKKLVYFIKITGEIILSFLIVKQL